MATSKIRLISLPNKKTGDYPRRMIEERGEMAFLHAQGPVYNPVYFDIHVGGDYFRGGHYHKLCTEIFYVICGACRIRYVDIETGEDGNLVAGPGDMVIIEPNCAHRLEAIQFCRVIEFSLEEEAYSKDTAPHQFE